METELNLLHLPVECLSNIFERCTISTLINLSDSCSKLRQIAHAYFATKLPTHTLSFKGLSDLEIRKTFRLFGALFRTIDSTHFESSEQSYFHDRFLLGLVRYCPNINDLTLSEFYFGDEVIEQIKIFFPQLKSFQMKNCYFQDWFDHNIFTSQCNELQTLVLHCAAVGLDPELSVRHFIFNQSFPKLTNISFRYSFLDDMPQFFQMNPQISCYEEHSCTNEIVRNVVQYLPNVHSLKFTFYGDKIIVFENIHRLQQLDSLYMTFCFLEAVIPNRLNSTSLQHLHLNGFILNYAATDITQLRNLKILHLEQCVLSADYVVEICKKCKNLTEIDALYSCDEFPTNNQLLEIVRHAGNLEKLTINGADAAHRISIDHFMRLAHTVRDRSKKLFIYIGSQCRNAIVHTFTDNNIEFKYTFLENFGNVENAADNEMEENQNN